MHAFGLTKLIAFGSFALSASLALAGAFYEKDGVAIKGFDPVAYFKDGHATKGTAEHTVVYKGSTFHFASAANREAFAANPGKYAP